MIIIQLIFDETACSLAFRLYLDLLSYILTSGSFRKAFLVVNYAKSKFPILTLYLYIPTPVEVHLMIIIQLIFDETAFHLAFRLYLDLLSYILTSGSFRKAFLVVNYAKSKFPILTLYLYIPTRG